MRVPQILPFALSLCLLVGWSAPGRCSEGDFIKLQNSARDAFNSGDYRRADTQLRKLLERLNFTVSRNGESRDLSVYLESTYKHLGECAMAQGNYDTADEYLRQSKAVMESLHETDSELDSDFNRLSTNYKQIDLTNPSNLGLIGPMVTAAVSEFHPNRLSISKTESGHHVTVTLADDVLKDIGSKAVTQVGVAKNTSFDLIQGEGGAVTLSNIIGVKVRAGFWVNIINATLKPDEMQHPVAVVTAQKMGISQAVTTSIPNIIYLPVVAIAGQVKNLFGPGSPSLQDMAMQVKQQVRGAIVQQGGQMSQQQGAPGQQGMPMQEGMYQQSGMPQQPGFAQQGIPQQPGFSQHPGTQQQPGMTPPAVATPFQPISPLSPDQPGNGGQGFAPVTNTTGDTNAPVTPIPAARPYYQQQGN